MNYIVTKNPEFFKKIGNYNYCSIEDLKLTNSIAVDSETTGLDYKLDDMFCLQIGTGSDNYIIDFYTTEDSYKFEDVVPFLKGKEQIFHNAVFDLNFFYKHNYFPRNVGDTMVQSQLLHNGKPFNKIKHNFGEVMLRELGIKYVKDEQSTINVTKLSIDESIQYCFNDVDRLQELHTKQMSSLGYKNMDITYNVHRNYIRALTYMEQCGTPIDESRLLAKIEKNKRELEEIKQEVIDFIMSDTDKFDTKQLDLFHPRLFGVLLSSSTQMIPVFKHFGIDTKDKEGKDSINKKILSKSSHPFLKLWAEYQNAQHDVTTYGKNILEQIHNGRLYTRYHLIKDTGRISTRKDTFNNLNLPAKEDMRSCIKAKEGFDMICADYSGQETVTSAYLSGDKVMTESILEDKDLHCAFTRLIYPELEALSDEEIINNHKKKRDSAKAPRFCFNFGGSAFTMHTDSGMPLDEAEKLETLYKEVLHPGVYKWGQSVYDKAIKVGYITNPSGFRLYLSYFDEFLELKRKYDKYDDIDWEAYNTGRGEHLLLEKAKEKEKTYKIKNPIAYTTYCEMRPVVSSYAKKKSAYMRLCLNNPCQSLAAHQTKTAAALLFDKILDNGDVWKVKICIIPHDEILLESKKELSSKYKLILEDCMIKGGNYFLKNTKLKMKAEANIGPDWWIAK